jgi:hypothetical protein
VDRHDFIKTLAVAGLETDWPVPAFHCVHLGTYRTANAQLHRATTERFA